MPAAAASPSGLHPKDNGMNPRITSMTFVGLLLLAVSLRAASPLDSARPLSLNLENVPITTVLDMVAAQNGLNIVVSGTVAGTVTLRLEDVPLAAALDAILLPMGYNYYVRNGVVVVKPFELYAPGELEMRSVELRYSDPVTVQKALEPLQSTQGKVIILDKIGTTETGTAVLRGTYKPNRILLADFPAVVAQMLDVIAQIDRPEQVISIEARIIETNVDDNTRVGFSWPTAFGSVLGGGSSDSGNTGDADAGDGAAVWDPNNGDFAWAKLTVQQVNLVLHLLEENGDSKLISDPRVTTLANHEAEIKIQTVIPIATINRFTEGAATQDIVTFQDQEVGISLRVTPRINEAGKITMDVMPVVEDIIGFAGPADNQKPITTERSVRTTITVADGETVALGGLRKEDEIESLQRVPLLGRIPLLGRLLFTNSSKEKRTTDLIILITPRVLP